MGTHSYNHLRFDKDAKNMLRKEKETSCPRHSMGRQKEDSTRKSIIGSYKHVNIEHAKHSRTANESLLLVGYKQEHGALSRTVQGSLL